MCDESYSVKNKYRCKIYYKNGTAPEKHIYHRTDEPAIEWVNGSKEWYINGELHRLDGPAIEHYNGIKRWFINDKEYSEEEYCRLISLLSFI